MLGGVQRHEYQDSRTNKGVRVKEFEGEPRHERFDKGTSTRVRVKGHDGGYKDMSTRTAERIKEYEQRSTREDLRHEREDKGASTRVRVKGYEG